MLAEYTARSHEALDVLVNEHKVQLRQFPAEVLRYLRELTDQVVSETAAQDEQFRKVYESARKFQSGIVRWTRIGDQAYYNVREAAAARPA
jgi:TRAP-type mannitol/chloroaromatic compound transport system substrate-binding protein